MSSQNSSDDIERWLKDVLFKEELTDFTFNILGNTEKGDGYMGDIVFVHVDGKTADDESKSFDLVLKCSKKSQALRDTVPVKDTFENEIYMYSQVFPAFQQFQTEKGIDDPFDSVPPYFGKLVSDNREILVLQNLKMLGYGLHERREPLDLNHLKLLLREYGKLHAISGAMQQQKPEVFQKLVGGIRDVWKMFGDSMGDNNSNKLFTAPIEEMYDLIKDDAAQNVTQRLLDLKNEVDYINKQLIYDRTHFSVINHGDNWNNNFMFKYDEETDETTPIKVAMIDWQIARFSSPVTDLSYFLYVCISKEHLRNFEDLLKEYHISFSNHLQKLGSDPEKTFPYSQLLEDWKVFGKFGLMMALLVIKIAISENDEVQDLTETVENGGEFYNTFTYEIKDKKKLKDRVLAVVEHAVNFGVL